MQTLVDYVRTKSLADPSMATVYKMIIENPDRVEGCLLLALEALYEANQALQVALIKANKVAAQPVIALAR